MTNLKLLNVKTLKNKNLAKIANIVCYDVNYLERREVLGEYINQDEWLRINEEDYQAIKEQENGVLSFSRQVGEDWLIHQAVIDEKSPSIEGIDFDFSSYKGKEIIFWTRWSGEKLLEVDVEDLTLRQREADQRQVSREQVQAEWEKEIEGMAYKQAKIIQVAIPFKAKEY